MLLSPGTANLNDRAGLADGLGLPQAVIHLLTGYGIEKLRVLASTSCPLIKVRFRPKLVGCYLVHVLMTARERCASPRQCA
jgi:hypothetical protein